MMARADLLFPCVSKGKGIQTALLDLKATSCRIAEPQTGILMIPVIR